jgi:hypothetical protein
VLSDAIVTVENQATTIEGRLKWVLRGVREARHGRLIELAEPARAAEDGQIIPLPKKEFERFKSEKPR